MADIDHNSIDELLFISFSIELFSLEIGFQLMDFKFVSIAVDDG
jgi:hypothetical protein